MTDDSDKRDYMERVQSLAKHRLGREATIDELAHQFALHGPDKRETELYRLDGELSSGQVGDLRRHHEIHTLRRKMGNVHETLRKANR